MNLTEILDELNIQPKIPIGSGMYHTAFPFTKFKDKIIKTKNGNLILAPDEKSFKITNKNDKLDPKEMDMFKLHPDIFAHVYKVTDRYAVIEKLETKTIKQELYKLSEDFLRWMLQNPDFAENLGWMKPVEYMEPDDFNVMVELNLERNNKEFLRDLGKSVTNKGFYLKLLEFIKKCYASDLGKKNLDLHSDNIGYDKQGNIKLLDF